MPVLNRKSNKF